MGVRHRAATVAALGLACFGGFSRPVMAQSVYAAGAVGADITLVSGQRSSPFSSPPGGEAFSGAARLGTVLNDRFGIELEVSRAGELRSTSQSGIPIPLLAVAPIFLGDVEFRTRVTTISTSASIRQQVSDAVALVYLGGIVFHRTDSEMTFRGPRLSRITIPTPPITISPGFDVISASAPFFLPPSNTDSVQYGVGPVVGFEAHIGYGEHFLIVPGVRMHGLPNSWLLRPTVGAGWRF